MAVEDKLLTVDEAAAHLRVKRHWLDTRRVEGRPPDYIKIGGKILYRLTVLEEFLNRSTVQQG